MLRKIVVASSIFIAQGNALAQNDCDQLSPSAAFNFSEQFKGTIEGELMGFLSRFAGAEAEILGEYKKFTEDNLENYPESHKLYVWQRLLYLACIQPNTDLNLSKLLELYLIGPERALQVSEQDYATEENSEEESAAQFEESSINLLFSNDFMHVSQTGLVFSDNMRAVRIAMRLVNIGNEPLLIGDDASDENFATTEMGDSFDEPKISGIKKISTIRRSVYEDPSSYTHLSPRSSLFMVWDIELKRGEQKILGSDLNLNADLVILDDGALIRVPFRVEKIKLSPN